MPVCVLFVSSRSGIVFNSSAGAITDHSQSAKDIDPYFTLDHAENVTKTYRYHTMPNIKTDFAGNLDVMTSCQGVFSLTKAAYHALQLTSKTSEYTDCN